MSFQPMIQTKDTPPSWGLHPYAEVGVVLEGKMEVNLMERFYLFRDRAGLIYIQPNLYHTMRNAGDTLPLLLAFAVMDDSAIDGMN